MKPLAEELRPKNIADFFGQKDALKSGQLFPLLLQSKKPCSILLWGPPGCGKTSLAKIYASAFTQMPFLFHPASHGLSDLKKWVDEIQSHPLFHPVNILFIDEIHRLNKSQQDALLPYVENGTFALIGATTENPSFCLNPALLSRVRVIALEPLDNAALLQILDKALSKKGVSSFTESDKNHLIENAKGDARHLLNNLESLLLFSAQGSNFSSSFFSEKISVYNKNGEEHFQYISALHKSIRGSDPDAALYWFCRMLQGGEDLNYVARRLVRIAIEDIGLADPNAQTVALHSWQTYERLGSPEGDLSLAETVLFLALAPKSNAAYKAFQKALDLAKSTSTLPPPLSIINAPTQWMKSQGYGKGYIYDHDVEGGFSGQNYFPSGLKRPSFYDPKEIGLEREMKKRKDFFAQKRKQKEDSKNSAN
jgi:putative ATPase